MTVTVPLGRAVGPATAVSECDFARWKLCELCSAASRPEVHATLTLVMSGAILENVYHSFASRDSGLNLI